VGAFTRPGSAQQLKAVISTFVIKLLRAYGLHAPWGAGRLFALRLVRTFSALFTPISIRTNGGPRFEVDINDPLYDELLLYGLHEPRESSVIRRVIHAGMTSFDIGANYGWYTMLFSQLVGQDGKVFAFEPMPPMYEKLQATLAANNNPANSHALPLALGDSISEVSLYRFDALPGSHSSMSTLGRHDFVEYHARMTTLDAWCIERALIDRVDFIKCDVEGAELSVLNGSSRMTSTKSPPVWMFELNDETSAALGYRPSDLVLLLRERFGYRRFYLVRGTTTDACLVPMQSPDKYINGDNVLCIPETRWYTLRESLQPLERP